MGRIPKKKFSTQKLWEDNIQKAKKVRKKWKEDFKVDQGYEYYEGKQQDSSYSDADWVTINTIYSHVKAQLPSLYETNPYFYVKLRRSFDVNPMNIVLWEKRGEIRSAMLNYLKEELHLKKKMRLAIQDAFFKYGVMKTHYYAETADNPDFGKAILSDDGMQQLFDDSGQALMEPEKIPVNCRYKLTRVLPDDMLWDDSAGTLEDTWSWVGQRIRMTLDEAKKNPNFDKQALSLLEGKGGSSDPELVARDERKKGSDIKSKSELRANKPDKKRDGSELMSFWEIYILENKTWIVIAEDGEIPMMEESVLPKGTTNHPFSFLTFTSREDSAYPIPRISQGIPIATEYNRARSDIQKHRKRFNRKYEVSRQHVGKDNDEVSKLESGDDGTIITVNQVGGIQPIKDAPLDQMRYQELGFLKAELVELLGGSSDEARGIAGADSATQAGILDKRLDIKEGDAMSQVIDFVTDIARKLDMLVQAHIDKEEAIKVTGPRGVFWELIKTEDYEKIDGEYEYSVNVGSTVPRLPQMERASWQAFIGLVAQNPHLLMSKRLLKNMAEQHHIEDETLVDELYNIGEMIRKGQLQAGNSGSQPGIPEDRPQSAIGGQAGGIQSLVSGNAAIQG